MTALPGLLDRGRGRRLAAVFAVHCAQAAAAAAGAFATRALFGALHAGATLPAEAVALLAVSGLGIAAARIAAGTLGEALGQAYALDIRQALFAHGTALAAHTVAAQRQGYTSLRFVGDMTGFRNWAGRGLPRLIAAAVLIPAALAVLGALHGPFLLAVAPVYAVALAAIGLAGLRLPALHRRLRRRRAAIAADMAERMPVAPALGALGRRSAEARRIARRSRRMIVAACARIRLAETLKAVPDAAAGIAAVGVIAAGARTGAATATIAAGLAAVGIALAPMRDLAGVWNHWAAYRAAKAKCAAALARPPRRAAIGGRALPRGPAAVSLRAVGLGPVRGLDADVAAGGRLSLTGPNGAGKSLLLSALAGLERLEAGEIRLAGIALPELSPGTLRRGVALVGPAPVILRGSLRRALTLGLDPRPDDAAILDRAGRLGLGPLVARTGGLDGQVGEAGRTLSEGERVKIALLRAMLLPRPRLVLIDGAVARLDAAGREALEAWLAATPATVIAEHRLAVLDAAPTLDLGVAASARPLPA